MVQRPFTSLHGTWHSYSQKRSSKLLTGTVFCGPFLIFFGHFDLQMVQRPFTSIHGTGHSCSQKRSSKLLTAIDKKILSFDGFDTGSQHVKICLNMSKRPSDGPKAIHKSPRYCCSQKKNWSLHINNIIHMYIRAVIRIIRFKPSQAKI